MEIEQLRKEFNQVLANIAEHSERFTDSDHVPALEVSVLMSKINKLQELAAILKYKIQLKEEQRRTTPKIATPIVEEIVVEKIEVVAEIIPEPITEQAPVVEEKIEIPVVEDIVVETIIEQAPSVKEVIVETPHAAVKTTEHKNTSISDKFLHTPIPSLKDAFSLNDRYLFANELFKKDMALFNETVKTIDSCSSLIAAQEILSQSQVKLNWDTENERVINFYELVERRFL